jgi:Dyp-type peroxidase family
MASPAVRILELLRGKGATLRRLRAQSAAPTVIEAGDVQGIVFRGYRGLAHCRYVFLELNEPPRARAWLGRVVPQVSPGAPAPSAAALHLAFTYAGLVALGLGSGALEGFSQPFIAGMAGAHRSRMLGDVGLSDPDRWLWGGPRCRPIHALLILYAASGQALAELYSKQRDVWSSSGCQEVYTLAAEPGSGREHFGFADGISQPAIEGYHESDSSLHRVKAGEFILGYPNEYGQLTERPLVEAYSPGAGSLPDDAGGTSHKDLGRNGSYLVARQLRQDVVAFRRTLHRLTQFPDGSANAAARDQLAAKIVGRWPSGAPLIETPWKDEAALATRNEFRYHARDPAGLACPIGAHIRRANPRDALEPNPGGDESLGINRQHRLLRRGRSYGPELAPGHTDDESRGLMFVALNANLARQFEFIQQSWLTDPRFNGLRAESDVISGALESNAFTVPATPVRLRYQGLPRFVSTIGGAYFFLPGLRALGYLASLSP